MAIIDALPHAAATADADSRARVARVGNADGVEQFDGAPRAAGARRRAVHAERFAQSDRRPCRPG